MQGVNNQSCSGHMYIPVSGVEVVKRTVFLEDTEHNEFPSTSQSGDFFSVF